MRVAPRMSKAIYESDDVAAYPSILEVVPDLYPYAVVIVPKCCNGSCDYVEPCSCMQIFNFDFEVSSLITLTKSSTSPIGPLDPCLYIALLTL